MSLVVEPDLLPSDCEPLVPPVRRREPRRGTAAAVICLMTAAVLLRVVAIDRLPGLNGDEAWSGVQVLHALRGESFAWRTPTGNPLNPFAILPLLASHIWLSPGVAHLRWVAVASGILALLVNFLLCRRAFDRSTAWWTTIAMAVLPVNVAYSRFAWDASQSLLFTLPVLYAPLIAISNERPLRWLTLGGLAQLAALLVHPTNVFAVPLLAIPCLTLVWPRREQLRNSLRGRRAMSLGLLLGGSVLAIAWAGRRYWALAIARAVSPQEFTAFLRLLLDLFTGLTVYRFVPGTLLEATAPGAIVLTIAGLVLLTAAVVGWTRTESSTPRERVLLASWVGMLLGFYLVAGAGALQPHYERYGQCLIGATVLMLVRGWQARLIERHAGWHGPALLAMAWLSVAGFAGWYLIPLAQSSGRPHRAFQTGACEPKLAALEIAVAEAHRLAPDRPLTIVASDWWSYWPLAYLAAGHRDVDVMLAVKSEAQAIPRPNNAEQRCYVEWIDSPRYDGRRRELAAQGGFRELQVEDNAGKPVLALFCESPQ